MTAPLFLVPPAALASGDEVEVTGPEGRHAVTVKRLTVGERVDVGDGAGHVVIGRVAAVHAPDRLVVQVVERRIAPEPQPRVVVVQAVPKGERGELAVSLLTEVGADTIVPWDASRCVAQWKGERGEKSWRKWESAARAAGKQSRRVTFPVLEPLATTREVAALVGSAACALVMHEEGTASLPSVTLPESGEVVIVVGPEGGITPEELAAFVGAGAIAVRMGPSVMRTSTAGTAAVSAVMAATGRWT
jgi:16S rRNA (uracil1498-N3)-methyltransferase